MSQDVPFEKKEICDGIIYRFKPGFTVVVTARLFPALKSISFIQKNVCTLKILGPVCGKQQIIAKSSSDPTITFPPVIYNSITIIAANQKSGQRTPVLNLDCLATDRG